MTNATDDNAPLKCEAPNCAITNSDGHGIYQCDVCSADICSEHSENVGDFGLRCADGEHLRPRLAPVFDDTSLRCAVCRKDTPHRWKPSPEAGDAWRCSECSTASLAKRYPCSPTCTHAAASHPEHPQKVLRLSMEFSKSMGVPLAGGAEESDDDVGRHPENDDAKFRTIENGVEGAVFTRTQAERYADKRAEAMRAACWEAVQHIAQVLVIGPAGVEMLKQAIEGATA